LAPNDLRNRNLKWGLGETWKGLGDGVKKRKVYVRAGGKERKKAKKRIERVRHAGEQERSSALGASKSRPETGRQGRTLVAATLKESRDQKKGPLFISRWLKIEPKTHSHQRAVQGSQAPLQTDSPKKQHKRRKERRRKILAPGEEGRTEKIRLEKPTKGEKEQTRSLKATREGKRPAKKRKQPWKGTFTER